MNNKKFISFLPYILVLGIMLLLISYGSEGNTKNFNYNEFMTKANTMTFTKAEMSMGTTVIDVKGSYSEKGKDVNFTVRVPNTEKNVSYLTDVFKKSKSTNLTVSDPNRESLLMKFLMNVFPFLLIAGVAFFMFSKMNAEETIRHLNSVNPVQRSKEISRFASRMLRAVMRKKKRLRKSSTI